jgi:hypothetical protein
MATSTRTGNLVGVCFMLLWCTIAFGMGLTALQFGAPFIFVLVPFGMGLFGIVFCLALMKGRSSTMSTYQGSQYRPITYTGDSFSREDSSRARERRTIYQVPSKCPSCGAAISTEEVDWVGPLQAKCPYCMATIDVEERLL